jgi:hypothetical protein
MVFRTVRFFAGFAFLVLTLPCFAVLTGCAFLEDLGQGLLSDEESPSRPSQLGNRRVSRPDDQSRTSDSGDTRVTGNRAGAIQEEPLASARISALSGREQLAGQPGQQPAVQASAIGTLSATGEAPSNGAITGLEVTWKIPEAPAEGFVLYFGGNPSRLESHVRVASDELETLQDPTSGAIYRYIIPDVPPDGPLFVALSSYMGAEEGPRSEAVEVRQAAPLSPNAH